MNIKVRLVIMNFLQFAVWGAYLTSMGSYLVNVGQAAHIGTFYAMQGIVSLFMPAILGIIADRWVPAQKLLSFSHFTAALFMALAGYYGMTSGSDVEFGILFTLYSLSVAFYMPTLALSNSVAYTALDKAGLDTIKNFPPYPYIRYHRIHLLHVDGGYIGTSEQLRPVLRLCPYRTGIRRLCTDPPCLSCQ